MIDEHSPLARIIERVPPPAEAVNGRGEWADAERALGTRLPDDYKRLVETYGRGDFWGALCLCTPFGDDNPVRLEADLVEDFGPLRESWPEEYPYPFFPEPGGLLTWAITDDSAQVCWLTEGPPESWPVVIWSRDSDYERFDCGAAAFLDGWISGRLSSELLHHEREAAPWFDAAIERDHVYVRLEEPEEAEEGGGGLPYAERLRILRDALAPTADRGGYEYDGRRQDHFVVTDTGWQLTYETAYGHQLRVAFPPADSEAARRAVLAAVDRMGCAVRSFGTVHGTSFWGPSPGPSADPSPGPSAA
ncbi:MULTISPECIES: SMI1/KNR4 family protein [unclassified Streptomyces]|uniref:SMI1/KNR4 family protein n=1 Tax=unclassified Streptomyces TaxID=2593676 RepID=UPI000889F5EF|nr:MULTISPECIES: SMI1/KNR4 family protein [unclassified Streptomyces]PBC83847.1 SUKH superfamily protein [Streptomyces sp. 2321.6]SDR37964.1 SMI1-KNR4 cell-wall [Streptomyces sp. KS_16]SED11002.1 SMI1-KNR4 cell-wall [Streptomyces sp. 2133.1]SNC69926.1 SMI1-KNR4 cell-wall [Streptomyces sp. 2114.4]